jgi:hypothetical protein
VCGASVALKQNLSDGSLGRDRESEIERKLDKRRERRGEEREERRSGDRHFLREHHSLLPTKPIDGPERDRGK